MVTFLGLKREGVMITARFALACCCDRGSGCHSHSVMQTWASAQSHRNPSHMSHWASYTGSVSCRKCHEKFYQLWAPSHHGLAMQPYTAELARNKLSPQTEEIVIGDSRYRADIAGETGWVIERGPEGEKKYRIDHVMGGKNVYYFLTSHGSRSAPDSARSVRREQEGMVRHGCERGASLSGSDG